MEGAFLLYADIMQILLVVGLIGIIFTESYGPICGAVFISSFISLFIARIVEDELGYTAAFITGMALFLPICFWTIWRSVVWGAAHVQRIKVFEERREVVEESSSLHSFDVDSTQTTDSHGMTHIKEYWRHSVNGVLHRVRAHKRSTPESHYRSSHSQSRKSSQQNRKFVTDVHRVLDGKPRQRFIIGFRWFWQSLYSATFPLAKREERDVIALPTTGHNWLKEPWGHQVLQVKELQCPTCDKKIVEWMCSCGERELFEKQADQRWYPHPLDHVYKVNPRYSGSLDYRRVDEKQSKHSHYWQNKPQSESTPEPVHSVKVSLREPDTYTQIEPQEPASGKRDEVRRTAPRVPPPRPVSVTSDVFGRTEINVPRAPAQSPKSVRPQTSRAMTTCPVCGVNVSERKLDKHIQKVHSQPSNTPAEAKKSRAMTTCPVCGVNVSERKLDKHLEKVHPTHKTSVPSAITRPASGFRVYDLSSIGPDTHLECRYCKGTITFQALPEHLASKHKIYVNIASKVDIVRHSETLVFLKDSEVSAYRRANSQGRVACPYCSKFIRKQDLYMHVKQEHYRTG